MNKKLIFLVSLLALIVLAVPVSAQDDAPPEPMPVSGTLNYTPTILAEGMGNGTVYFDATEDEVWSGDFEGTAVAPFRAVITPDGAWDGWILSEFEGTVLGEYTGTMVMVTRYQRYAGSAHWFGEWMILSGTGDLENLHGSGTAWGPGFNPEDPEAEPDIYYSGEVFFVEPVVEG